MTSPIDTAEPELCALPDAPVPEGARAGWLVTTDGLRLRYARWPKTGGAAKGTICLVQGRTEFIEKYFETVADFQSRGFAVASFDWRGQGGSQRILKRPMLGHVDSFDDYVTDLVGFHTQILLPDCPPPFYLVGHSMGGLVALLAGLQDRMMFDRMFLSAPMVGLDRLPFSLAGTARLADALCFAGLGTVPVGRRQDALPTAGRFPGNAVTADVGRYMHMVDVLAARPDLGIGPPTVRWSAAACRAMLEVGRDTFPNQFRVPLLMLGAARDEVVSTAAIESLGLRMRNGRHAVIPGARHELFMETDAIRSQVFAAFDAFITEQSD